MTKSTDQGGAESKATRKIRKGRVFWNDTEWKTVISESVLAWFEDSDHLWTYIAKAQSRVLPEGRHRKIMGNHIVSDEVREKFEAARAEFLTLKETVPEQAEIPTPTPPVTPAPVPQPQPLDRAAIVASLTDAEFYTALAQRLGPIMAGFGALTKIAETLAGRPERRDSPEPTAPPPTKTSVESQPSAGSTPVLPAALPVKTPKRTKVLLFGFGADEVLEIRRKSESFDMEISFVTQLSGEPVPKIPMCDWCIIKHRASLTRKAMANLRIRPGNKNLIDAGTPATALQRLNDINSKQQQV